MIQMSSSRAGNPESARNLNHSSMRIIVDVPEYEPALGLRFQWDAAFEIQVHARGDEVTIAANAAGLRSLARHLLTLAQETVAVHTHFHLDSSNSLAETSGQLIVEKV
jgi:hypothetical protein